MKSRKKKVLRTGIFVFIVLVIFIMINSLFQPIWYSWEAVTRAKGFYDEPKNTIETVIVGTSVAASGVSPMELYDEYGICAYNLATIQQPIKGTYYWVEEAYRLHPETLKTVVFDVSGLRVDVTEYSYQDDLYHRCYDYMRMSNVKLRAIKDYADGDRQKIFEYLFPIAAYHDRWNDLNNDDLTYYVDDLNNAKRGYEFRDTFYASNVTEVPVFDTTYNKNEEPGEYKLIKESVETFEDMLAFCEERDIEVVLTKFATSRWDSYMHKEVQELADEKGLTFIDYNFAPLYDEMNYVFAFDNFDSKHSNYYGAYKYSTSIGKYLVENCGVKDVRGDEKYKYMEEQSAEYDARIRQRIALQGAETITEYLNLATNDDNTVFITVKDSAATTLTDEQRDSFRKMGLKKLADLDNEEPYLAVVDRGEVVYEESKSSDKGDPLIHEGSFSGDNYYNLKSGGFNNGRVAYCSLNSKEYGENLRGLNVVVYNHIIDEVIDSTVFDTHAYRSRDTYTVDKAKEVAELPEGTEVDPKSLTGQIQEYMQREEDFRINEKLRAAIGKDDKFAFLDAYVDDPNNLIILAGRKDLSNSLNDQVRARLLSYGLIKYADIDYGESYVAIIEGGNVIREISRSADEDITVKELGIYIMSGGAYSGRTSSIEIDGKEYAGGNELSIVVYDQAENRVIDHINF